MPFLRSHIFLFKQPEPSQESAHWTKAVRIISGSSHGFGPNTNSSADTAARNVDRRMLIRAIEISMNKSVTGLSSLLLLWYEERLHRQFFKPQILLPITEDQVSPKLLWCLHGKKLFADLWVHKHRVPSTRMPNTKQT